MPVIYVNKSVYCPKEECRFLQNGILAKRILIQIDQNVKHCFQNTLLDKKFAHFTTYLPRIYLTQFMIQNHWNIYMIIMGEDLLLPN